MMTKFFFSVVIFSIISILQGSNGYTYTSSFITTPYYTSHHAYSNGPYQVPQNVSFFDEYLRPHHKSHSLNFPQYKNAQRHPYLASPISIKTAQTTALKDQAVQKVQKRPSFASEPVDFYSPFHRGYGRFQTSEQPLKVKTFQDFNSAEPVQANIVQDRPKPLKTVLENLLKGQTPAVPIQQPILPIRTTPKPTIRY